jgi:rSAM/selenodomain-associated transferase 1
VSEPDCPILVFAKAPVPGQVKTRLIPAVGPAGAALLHEWLCRQTLKTATTAGVGPVELWCAPSVEHGFFRRCAEEFRVGLHNQAGCDLGERMAHALAETLGRAPRALVVGTDCPGLTAEDLGRAAAVLAQGADAVISPAKDGGYVLLGTRRFAPELFRDIPWGSARVLEETRARLRALGWNWKELPERWDVDRPEDLALLATVPAARGLAG